MRPYLLTPSAQAIPAYIPGAQAIPLYLCAPENMYLLLPWNMAFFVCLIEFILVIMVPSLMNWNTRKGRGGGRYLRGGIRYPTLCPFSTATLTESGSISKATYLSQCRSTSNPEEKEGNQVPHAQRKPNLSPLRYFLNIPFSSSSNMIPTDL